MSPGTPAASLSTTPAERAIQTAIHTANAHHPGLAWWAARAVHLQQRLLKRNALSLQRALLHLLTVAAEPFDTAAVAPLQPLVTLATTAPPDGSALAAALAGAYHIEAAYVWLDYRHVSTAREHLAAAGQALQLSVSTTGAMGTRTEAQVDAKAQLVLQVDRAGGSGAATPAGPAARLGPSGDVAQEVWPQAEQGEGSVWAGWEDDTGVRHVPRLRGEAGAASSHPPLPKPLPSSRVSDRVSHTVDVPAPPPTVCSHTRLDPARFCVPGRNACTACIMCTLLQGTARTACLCYRCFCDGYLCLPSALQFRALRAAGRAAELAPLEQAFVLALATVENRGGAHAADAGDWLLTPYVDALLMQPHTRHAVAVCTLLMRARHEVRRVRVRERGLVTLQAMHDHLQVRRCPSPQAKIVVAKRLLASALPRLDTRASLTVRGRMQQPWPAFCSHAAVQ